MPKGVHPNAGNPIFILYRPKVPVNGSSNSELERQT